MRGVGERGLALIKHFEGFSARVYLDIAGLPTIGYGHLIKAGEDFSDGITEAEAEQLLKKDIGIAERAVLRYITPELTEGQFDALVSFTFNLGGGALQRSTLRQKINRGEHEEVPAEFMKWVWAGGRKSKGLVRRRAAEALLYKR